MQRMIFTNKHVVIAMIVAPVLAILAWFAVGQIAGEQAQPAQRGQSYPLVAKSNCRYASGRCDLENEDFKLALRFEPGDELLVQSAHPLQGIMISVGSPGQDLPPVAMTAVDTAGMNWRYSLSAAPGVEDRIRLVASTGASAYFGESTTVFIKR